MNGDFSVRAVTSWIVSHSCTSGIVSSQPTAAPCRRGDTPLQIPRISAPPCHYRHQPHLISCPSMLHRTEEVARMIQLTMYCSGCSVEQPFGQLHGEPASCPDV